MSHLVDWNGKGKMQLSTHKKGVTSIEEERDQSPKACDQSHMLNICGKEVKVCP